MKILPLLAVATLGAPMISGLVWNSAAAKSPQREITITPGADSSIPCLAQVVVSKEVCAAVNDSQSVLVVGSRSKNNQHLSVFRLDATGNLASAPAARLALPRADSLKAFPHYPLSKVFH